MASVSSDYCEHNNMFFYCCPTKSSHAAANVCNRPSLEGKHDRDDAAEKLKAQ